MWQPQSIVLWTPTGVMSVLLPEARVVAHPTPQMLRSRITRARQLSHHRIVGMAGAGTINFDGPPMADRLVIFSASTPDDAIDLGDATSWFPCFDGAGVWRVRQRYGGVPLGIRPVGAFEATPFLLNGQQRGPMVVLPEGRCPVAATADGLAVAQEVPPDRPYPAHVAGQARTEKGGDSVDLVRYDPSTGEIGTVISEYTRVMEAESHGLALVTNGDPNIRVRPTEVIDLATGAGASTEARPELSWWVFPQPRTTSSGHGITAHLLGPRVLVARSLSGGRQIDVQLTDDLRPTSTGTAFRRDQDFAWLGDLLLFAEEAADGVSLAMWSPGSGETIRLPVAVPTGSYPLGGARSR